MKKYIFAFLTCSMLLALSAFAEIEKPYEPEAGDSPIVTDEEPACD